MGNALHSHMDITIGLSLIINHFWTAKLLKSNLIQNFSQNPALFDISFNGMLKSTVCSQPSLARYPILFAKYLCRFHRAYRST
jgi:hypothetical protein